MSLWLCVAVLATSVWSQVLAGSVPKCDPSITSRMKEFYPNGIPNNIIQSIKNNERYSYIIVSSSEAKKMGIKAKCIGISMPSLNKAKVSYKLGSLPTYKASFPVREENGILYQQDGMEYKLYVLYFSDAGVIFTYRCCDGCSGSAPNVGIAVADKLKSKRDTKAALSAAKAKMHDLGLDKDVVDVPSCKK